MELLSTDPDGQFDAATMQVSIDGTYGRDVDAVVDAVLAEGDGRVRMAGDALFGLREMRLRSLHRNSDALIGAAGTAAVCEQQVDVAMAVEGITPTDQVLASETADTSERAAVGRQAVDILLDDLSA